MTQPNTPQPGPQTPEEKDEAQKGAAAGAAGAAGCALFALYPWLVIGLVVLFFVILAMFSWRG